MLILTFCSLLTFLTAQEVEKAFIEHDLDKDVIKPVPKKILKVYYQKSNQLVNLGEEITPKSTRDPPVIEYEAESGSYYTLSMSAIDVPTRMDPKRIQWKHWLVVNIPGSDFSKGETLSEYIPAGPPINSGLHRYVFILFKQQKNIEFHEAKHSKFDMERGIYSVEKFGKKYNLGDPVAGNFFLTQYDDSVPELYKQLELQTMLVRPKNEGQEKRALKMGPEENLISNDFRGEKYRIT